MSDLLTSESVLSCYHYPKWFFVQVEERFRFSISLFDGTKRWPTLCLSLCLVLWPTEGGYYCTTTKYRCNRNNIVKTLDSTRITDGEPRYLTLYSVLLMEPRDSNKEKKSQRPRTRFGSDRLSISWKFIDWTYGIFVARSRIARNSGERFHGDGRSPFLGSFCRVSIRSLDINSNHLRNVTHNVYYFTQ